MQQRRKLNNFHIRNTSIGNERRKNMHRSVMEYQPHTPRPVMYEDIDLAVLNWFDKEIKVQIGGKEFPTYKLFSNQKISEYGQAWDKIDENGNLEINFKSVTRENNPNQGSIQNKIFNIPGHYKIPLAKIPVVEEDGKEALMIYSMEQPTAADLIYTLSVVTNSYSVLNSINTTMLHEFNAIQRYISPNGYWMPMILDSISDASDYTLEDRKYYSQSFTVKVTGFIIREEDFIVKKVPITPRINIYGGRKTSSKVESEFLDETDEKIIYVAKTCEEGKLKREVNSADTFNETVCPVEEVKKEIEIEDFMGISKCWAETEDEFFVKKKCNLRLNFNPCKKECEFTIGNELKYEEVEIESIVLNNIYSYKIYINDVEINMDDAEIRLYRDDKVKIETEFKNPLIEASITFISYDPTTIVENDGDEEEIQLTL